MNLRKALILWALALSAGCAPSPDKLYQEAMTWYRKDSLALALPKFEELANKTHSAYAFAWLAETCRRLGYPKEAVANARTALRIDPCNAFAHTVIADASNPTQSGWDQANDDTTWVHLMQAIRCDSMDGNTWLSVWVESAEHQDIPLMKRAMRSTVATGFFTPPALAFGRWMLRALPPFAVLLTNGDMDTFPLLAVQETEGFRKDVIIVNRSLLNAGVYAAYVRDHCQLPIPPDMVLETAWQKGPPSEQIFKFWLSKKSDGSFGHPLALACTMDQGWIAANGKGFQYTGPFFLWNGDAGANAPFTFAKESLEGIEPKEFLGSFFSPADRSPLRAESANALVHMVAWTAIINCTYEKYMRNYAGAWRWLRWAEDVDVHCAAGPTLRDKIQEQKESLASPPDQ